MPPKRKQPDDSAAEASSSTRSTRGSTRSTTTKNTAKETASGATTKKSTGKGAGKAAAATKSSVADAPDGEPPARATKKARTTTSTTARKNASKTTAKAGAHVDDGPTPIRKTSSIKASRALLLRVVCSQPNLGRQEIAFNHVPTNHQNHQPVVEPPSNPPPPPAKKSNTKYETFTPQRASELFKKYADNDDADVIGPEGFEQLCTDANMPLDGPRPIIFAWQMGAKDMAKVTKDEWTKGTSQLKISSVTQIELAISELDDLLIQGKAPVRAAPKNQEYDRSSYFSYSADVKSGFSKLYSYAFALAKPEASRNIDMETSVAFWTVLLVPKYPIMKEIIDFINEKGTYKATNKDLWTMMLEFCETVTPNLQGYDPDAAWPTLLDDFVAWKTASPDTEQAAN